MMNLPPVNAEGTLLRELEGIRSLYILPDDPLVDSAIIPCFSVSDSVDCMMGYFSSESLVALAPGLATFIDSSSKAIRLIISPVLTAADQKAIEAGVNSTQAASIATNALNDALDTENFIQRHTLKCLTWLLQNGRLEIRVALMKNALFHPKVWLFHQGGDTIAAHGSSNMTGQGIQRNIEQVAVSRSWDGGDNAYSVRRFIEQFGEYWTDSNHNCIVVDMPEAVKSNLLRNYSSTAPPKESDLRDLYKRAEERRIMSEIAHKPKFSIPSYLRYEDGPFAHQGAAVRDWLDNGCRGVLEMATGAGKTNTSLIGAKKLSERIGKPLLIVVAAPYVPLIQQWRGEIEPFGIDPVNLSAASGQRGRAAALGRLRRRMRRSESDTQAVVVTHDTLCNPIFQKQIADFGCATLLIADEVHNLGRSQFIDAPPDFFDYRMGLSATPERQYDEEGTERLFKYFGDVVFRFTLEESIGVCLAPYDYFIHPVELTSEELDRWDEISEKIRAQAWRQEEGSPPDEYVAKLLRDRREVVENAENKVAELRRLLDSETRDSLRHTLIYASDKNPEQLDDVNRLLLDKGVLFHQLTAEETANRKRTRDILQEFQDGALRVLTAKRVLDEGVNIPQVRRAYILASTTVRRQWTQRRGRLLRKCDEIGKTHSEIHDFVALPPEDGYHSADDRAIYRGELTRAQEFASLARNAGSPGGPLDVLAKLIRGAAM